MHAPIKPSPAWPATLPAVTLSHPSIDRAARRRRLDRGRDGGHERRDVRVHDGRRPDPRPDVVRRLRGPDGDAARDHRAPARPPGDRGPTDRRRARATSRRSRRRILGVTYRAALALGVLLLLLTPLLNIVLRLDSLATAALVSRGVGAVHDHGRPGRHPPGRAALGRRCRSCTSLSGVPRLLIGTALIAVAARPSSPRWSASASAPAPRSSPAGGSCAARATPACTARTTASGG